MKPKNNTLQYIAYSFGNFANTIAYQVFGNRIQFYYIDVIGLNPAIAGIVWTIYGIWNTINDPLMGQVTDRTRSRMGRRVPYVMFGAIPLGLSFFFLWTPPNGSPWVVAAYFFMLLFIFDTIYSLTIIAYNALFPEIAPDLKNRVKLSSIREILATIALLLSYIVAPILSEELGFVWMGAIMGAFIAVGYLVSMIGVKESPESIKDDAVGILTALKYVWQSIPFRWFVVANLCKEYVFLILGASLPFWRKYVLGITTKTQVFGMTLGAGDTEAFLLGIPFLLCVPAILIWQKFIPRLGVRRAWILANLFFMPGLLIMALASNFYMGLLGTVLIVPGLSGYMVLPFIALAEIIDTDAAVHGMRREGIFFGMNGGIVKLAFSVQGLFFAGIFSSTGFVAGAAAQTATAIWGIRFLIGITPIIFAIIGTFCMFKFSLGQVQKAIPAREN